MSIILLDPSDQALITINWAEEALPQGVTLQGNVVHTVPSPLTKVSEATNNGAGTSQVKVSGAVHGGVYMIEAQATLSNGEVINRQFPARGFNS
jgi:hypothetical protein